MSVARYTVSGVVDVLLAHLAPGAAMRLAVDLAKVAGNRSFTESMGLVRAELARRTTLTDQEWMREQAKKRPADFAKLSARERWEIDKRLGISDWDGMPHKR